MNKFEQLLDGLEHEARKESALDQLDRLQTAVEMLNDSLDMILDEIADVRHALLCEQCNKNVVD